MALIFDEQFEATGYDETSTGVGSNWTEEGNGTIDENFATSSVTGAPARWGDQCLKVVPGSTGATTTNTLDTAVTAAFYLRFDFIINSDTTNDYNNFFTIQDSSYNYCVIVRHNNVSGSTYLQFGIDGTEMDHPPSGNGYGPISKDTPYRIDIYYNGTDNAYEIKINGVSQYTGTATLANVKYIAATSYNGYTGDIIFFDNIQIATDGWVPADSAGPYTSTRSGSFTSSGIIKNKSVTKRKGGSLSNVGIILKKAVTKTYAGALSSAGSLLSKAINKQYSGALSHAGNLLNKTITKVYAGSLSYTGGILNKTITKVYDGALSFTGAATNLSTKLYDVTKDGVLDIIGDVSRNINLLTNVYDGVLTFAGSILNKSITKIYDGVLTLSGALLNKSITKTDSGAITLSGEVTGAAPGETAVSATGDFAPTGTISKVEKIVSGRADGELGFSGTATNDYVAPIVVPVEITVPGRDGSFRLDEIANDDQDILDIMFMLGSILK